MDCVGLLARGVAGPLMYADTGHAALVEPVLHVDGKPVSDRCAEFSLRQELLEAVRRYNVPPVPSTATQYLLPDAMAVTGMVTVFHVPPTGEVLLPDARRAAG